MLKIWMNSLYLNGFGFDMVFLYVLGYLYIDQLINMVLILFDSLLFVSPANIGMGYCFQLVISETA
jgi:hypothetical protein